MLRDHDLEQKAYDPQHVQQVLAEIKKNFFGYFKTFSDQSLEAIFKTYRKSYEQERSAYREYLSLEALDEFEYDPNAFKSHTRKQCPIIRRCVMSPDEVMKDYRASFNMVTGRQLLDTVRRIAEFGVHYVATFDAEKHEASTVFGDLGLETLNQAEYGCGGVIGYGIQSSLLYGVHARQFAHRSQNAVWSLYFLSGRKDFGLRDGSEFLMIRPDQGTCEQNFFYPAEMFGFYALQVFLLLKSACENVGVPLQDDYRYVYLDSFFDHVADRHRDDINTYKRSSEYVESQPWF